MKFSLPITLPKAFRSSFQEVLNGFRFDDTPHSVIPFLVRAFGASQAIFMLETAGGITKTCGCACGMDGEIIQDTPPFSQVRDTSLVESIKEDLQRRTAAVTYSALSWPHPRTALCEGSVLVPREYNLLLPISDTFTVASNHTPRFSGWLLLLFDRFPDLSEELIQLVIMLPEVFSQLVMTAIREESMQREHLGLYAHDVKHHLMVVDELLFALRNSQGGKADRVIEKLEKTLRTLMLQTNSVLLTDKHDAGHLQVSPLQITINELVLEAVQDLEPLFRAAGRGLLTKLEASLAPSPIDPAIFPTVVHNLLDNALKYSNDDSVVNVRTYSLRKGVATLEVSSQGSEIAPEERKLVFRRHFRAKNSVGKSGSGLGLYLVRQVVEAHKGRVELDVQGATTRFLVHLPMLDSQATTLLPTMGAATEL